jgi:hypothetical protein
MRPTSPRTNEIRLIWAGTRYAGSEAFRSLVCLKHEICPAILLCHGDIGRNISRVHVFKRTFVGAAAGAAEAVHPTFIGCSV